MHAGSWDKSQAPNSKSQTNLKLQITNKWFGVLCLEFGACLLFGACNLEFSLKSRVSGLFNVNRLNIHKLPNAE